MDNMQNPQEVSLIRQMISEQSIKFPMLSAVAQYLRSEASQKIKDRTLPSSGGSADKSDKQTVTGKHSQSEACIMWNIYGLINV